MSLDCQPGRIVLGVCLCRATVLGLVAREIKNTPPIFCPLTPHNPTSIFALCKTRMGKQPCCRLAAAHPSAFRGSCHIHLWGATLRFAVFAREAKKVALGYGGQLFCHKEAHPGGCFFCWSSLSKVGFTQSPFLANIKQPGLDSFGFGFEPLVLAWFFSWRPPKLHTPLRPRRDHPSSTHRFGQGIICRFCQVLAEQERKEAEQEVWPSAFGRSPAPHLWLFLGWEKRGKHQENHSLEGFNMGRPPFPVGMSLC